MQTHRFLIAIVFLVGIVAVGVAVVTQPFVRVVASHPPQVDSKRLEAHVKHLSVDLYPRSYDQTRKLDLAAQYILSEFKAAGAAVTVQEVLVRETKYKNIVATFGPATGPIIVIGAHYDSWGQERRR